MHNAEYFFRKACGVKAGEWNQMEPWLLSLELDSAWLDELSYGQRRFMAPG